MITHGNMTRTIVLLAALYRGRIGSFMDFQLLSKCAPGDRLWLERFCELCNLTRLTHGAKEELTEKGRAIAKRYIDEDNVLEAYRGILREYIFELCPPWAFKMPAGREESFAAMNDDERFCFKEAGLSRKDISDDVVIWWDDVASKFRPVDEKELMRIGRCGERLTIQYESGRTGRKPYWAAVDSNYAGYDILSCESANDPSNRLIEVKSTSKLLSCADFYITCNEWETALASMERYYFYLWVIGSAKMLAIITAGEMAGHIARNVGSGHWLSIAVPFRAFEDKFFVVGGRNAKGQLIATVALTQQSQNR